MKQNNTAKKWIPIVTSEDIARFQPGNDETRTRSELIDAVLEALSHTEVLQKGCVADYLGVDNDYLYKAVKLVSGMTLNEIRAEVIYNKWCKIIAQSPKLTRPELAAAIGFRDRSVLLHFRDRWNKKNPDRQIKVLVDRNFSDKRQGGWKF